MPAKAPLSQLSGITADFIEVDKSDRVMRVYSRGSVVREYEVALGFAPEGDKLIEGDGRTPEGLYTIDRRNPESQFHLSLGISYPNTLDRAQAAAVGQSPGGNIFIHGQPNGLVKDGEMEGDWTAGCIAVTNAEIREIWSMVPNGVVIAIRP